MADVSVDISLKKKTRQAHGETRKHAWNAQRKKADDIVLPRSPDATKAVHSDNGALPRLPVVAEVVPVVVLPPGPSCSTFSDNPVIGSLRASSSIHDHVDMVFFSAEQTAERVRNAADSKETLASQ